MSSGAMDVARNFLSVLTPAHRALVGAVANLARELGTKSYCVGGALRDFFLERPIVDVDLMLEAKLAELLSVAESEWERKFQGLPRPKKILQFGQYYTAKILFEGDSEEARIDLSQARKEQYLAPAARPEVSVGDLSTDLARRDFAMNAMAAEFLAEKGALHVELRDPFGGVDDIAKKSIRVLHDASFRDDPVRLLRAVRFQVRLGFSNESRTEDLFDDAVRARHLLALSPTRLFEEFRKILEEGCSRLILERLEQRGVLEQISPLGAAHSRVQWNEATSWENKLAELCNHTPEEVVSSELDRFKISRAIRKRLVPGAGTA